MSTGGRSATAKRTGSASKKRNPLERKLTKEQEKTCEKAFDLHCEDADYGLTADELSKLRKFCGFSPSLWECEAAVAPFDPKGMSIASFKIHFGILTVEKKARSELLGAFHLFDKKRTGRITRETLRETATFLKEPLSDETIRQMMKEADESKKGYLEEEDFIKFLMSEWLAK